MVTEARFGGLEFIDLTPLYIVSFEDGWRARDLLGVQKAILARDAARVIFIVEVLHIRPAGALERKDLSATLTELQARLDPRTIASIVITDSSIMRGVIRAVTWVHPVPYPLLTVSSVDEAREVAEERMRAEKLELSSEARVELRALARKRQKVGVA
jgi:hypothetical protein